MANFVKTKISVTAIAVVIIVLIPLLRSNFNAPPSFTRWGQPMSWDNFEGVPRIFSRFDAGISSAIYLRYDSALKQYYSYAAIDNNYSWAKPGVKDSMHYYLLNHERYHFNISEVHARMMNQFIKANPGFQEGDYTSKYYELQRSLRVMQDYYDYETNHSVNQSIQRRWEYKIDSLLQIHDGDSGFITDYYSGAQVFMPIKPDGIKGGVNSYGVSYRYFGINQYGMTLLCLTYQFERNYENDLVAIEQAARNTYDYLEYPVRSLNILSGNGDTYLLRFIAEDTVNHTRVIDHWSASRNYLFRVSAEIHSFAEDTVGYYQIAESFLNSFKVINTDDYWISKSKSDTTHFTVTPMVVTKTPQEHPSSTCYTIPPAMVRGFYRGPIPFHDQWLIAYDILDQPDSLISEHALYVNNELITFNNSTDDILYLASANEHQKSPFTIAFGYVLKNDSISGCPILHNQRIMID